VYLLKGVTPKLECATHNLAGTRQEVQPSYLLKVIGGKGLKTVDIQHSHTRSTVFVLPDGCVDAGYEPIKHLQSTGKSNVVFVFYAHRAECGWLH